MSDIGLQSNIYLDNPIVCTVRISTDFQQWRSYIHDQSKRERVVPLDWWMEFLYLGQLPRRSLSICRVSSNHQHQRSGYRCARASGLCAFLFIGDHLHPVSSRSDCRHHPSGSSQYRIRWPIGVGSAVSFLYRHVDI